MAQYKVVNQRVEINGKTREIGAVLEESDFNLVPPEVQEGQEPSLNELDSLLKSGHVIVNV